ncbi:hypothetical protein ABZ816_34565 [Actinosynnema sp. NPDC047251]|uniref:hypothetical protein n=1 Tax=Saccharothrix espanaensis TaxID=103731 RepID=UPI0002FB900C|nr:hypothetical protein [Saccharothrix espanaensis]
MWSRDSGFREFDARVEAAGDDAAALGAALLDRGLVRLAAGAFEDAQSDQDAAGDVLHEAGHREAAALAASVASLTARLHGDLDGAVARALFARGWAPPETMASVAGQIAVAESAMDAGDLGPGMWAYVQATNVFGDAGLGEDTRDALAAYSDWLNEADNADHRPPTPDLTGRQAAPHLVDAVGRAVLGQIPVDRLDTENTTENTTASATEDPLGHAAVAATRAVLHFRLDHGRQAAEAIVDAHLLGATVPPT